MHRCCLLANLLLHKLGPKLQLLSVARWYAAMCEELLGEQCLSGKERVLSSAGGRVGA